MADVFYKSVCDPAFDTIYKSTVDVIWQFIITTQAASDITTTTITANGTIEGLAANPIVRRGFCWIEASSGDPTVADETTYEDTDSTSDGLILSTIDGTIVDVGYYIIDEVIDLIDIFTSRVSATIVVTATDLYSDLYDFADLYTLTDLYGIGEGQTNVSLEIRITDDDPDAAPVWSAWQAFVIGDYTARAYQFRIKATGTAPGITPLISSLVITIDMEDRVYPFAESIQIGGTRVTYVPAFYAKPEFGIAVINGQAGDHYTVTLEDETGFTIEFTNGNDSVARTITGVARGYGYLE